ncbi:MAG: nitric oxide reductase activation protein NorD, partial [Nitrospiraceae bacterium]
MPSEVRDQLQIRLSEHLEATLVVRVIEGLARSTERPDALQAILILLKELDDASGKAAKMASETFPELARRGLLGYAVPWLDLGLAIAQASGAAALRYFKESALLLSLIEPPSARETVLRLGLELSEEDHTVALELLRVAPECLSVIPAEELERWAVIGAELARTNHVVGVEFIRQTAAIARVLAAHEIRLWIELGLKLVTRNSLGNTDYLGTVEFFRTSPAMLGEIYPVAARALTLTLSSCLADTALEIGTTCLAEAAPLLQRMPSDEWRLVILQYGLLVAERDAQSALAYLRRSPEMLSLLGSHSQTRARFEEWFKAGMDVLGYSLEAGRAYFAVETHRAIAAVEQALSGVPLRRVARSLTLFAQALSGTGVTIQALPEIEGQRSRATVSVDGRTINLPSLLRRYGSFDENVHLYMAMTAHEAGHLEFGTYNVPMSLLADVASDLRLRFAKPNLTTPASLADLFALYPQPKLIGDLWTLLEDARVEFLLRQEYPGLSRDLTALAREAVQTRTLSHGLTIREMVIDLLLLLSTDEPGTVAIPEGVADVVSELWTLCRTVMTAGATAEDAIRVAHHAYLRLEELLAARQDTVVGENRDSPDMETGVGPRASEDMSEEYQPLTNWDYRGAMDPNLVKDRSEFSSSSGTDQSLEGGLSGSSARGASDAGTSRSQETSNEELAPGRQVPSLVDEVLTLEGERPAQDFVRSEGAHVTRYPEWDWVIQDYRHNWTRVLEREAEERPSDFVERTLAAHSGAVTLLRRYFESIFPTGYRRVAGQLEGDDIDIDAAVRRVADMRAGAEPSDRIYIKGEKHEREVAAACLVDVSGSTSRQVANGRRVIDIEKEGLVLLCEALEAIGDQFAMYAYSGQGRNRVDFIVVKDFDDPIGGKAAHKLGGVAPLHQNRDGAAIRHATQKLLARQVKTRLLVLISDGRPLDDGYKDDYS